MGFFAKCFVECDKCHETMWLFTWPNRYTRDSIQIKQALLESYAKLVGFEKTHADQFLCPNCALEAHMREREKDTYS